jgi:antitoxin (DNA-binding transcriptional repressor) of toxin-antitoxin stability system
VTTYVGVRERTAAGETIVVTRRGEAVAEIRAVSVDERIRQGVREGWE